MFLCHYSHQMLARDFFTVETLWLKTTYVLFFIELGTHCVYFAGWTERPTSIWVTQQARQLCWTFEAQTSAFRYLLHDRDAKFTVPFDTVFAAQNIEVIHIPVRAPNANAYAERWVRAVHQECLDQLLIFNERHLNFVLREYIHNSNTKRPHQGIHQRCPEGTFESVNGGTVNRRMALDGPIKDYYREVASRDKILFADEFLYGYEKKCCTVVFVYNHQIIRQAANLIRPRVKCQQLAPLF